jgi:DNA repair exonuclease SbcCD ATPase subunit
VRGCVHCYCHRQPCSSAILQDAHFHERRADSSESQVMKLTKEVKQKTENVSCLMSKLSSKEAELAQREKSTRDVNQELMHSSREAAEAVAQNQVGAELFRTPVLSAFMSFWGVFKHSHGVQVMTNEMQAARATIREMDERLKAVRAAHSSEVASLNASLAAAANDVQQKQAVVAQCEARLQQRH